MERERYARERERLAKERRYERIHLIATYFLVFLKITAICLAIALVLALVGGIVWLSYLCTRALWNWLEGGGVKWLTDVGRVVGIFCLFVFFVACSVKGGVKS